MFQQFPGTLDGSGRATARFDTFGPLGASAAGSTLTFRFILGPPPGFDYLSNPVPLDLTP